MAHVHAEQEAVIAAPADVVYGILADYHQHHPHVLPKQYFSDLTVEEGGQGAGTTFRVRTHALGVEHAYHMRVTEPEPGRVLAETDIDSGLVTTFTVTPTNDGTHARVRIATDWETSPGLAGIIEKLLTPMVMRRIYAKELRQLDEYARNTQTPA